MNNTELKGEIHSLNDNLFKKKHSFIYRIREYCFEKFGVWDMWDLLPYRWRMHYYDTIKPFFSPSNKRIRKSIPRQYRDISSLIEDVNFEFIKAFYEEEYKADIVNWNATKEHKEFKRWLESAYKYVTVKRPDLQKQLENAYPPSKPIEEWFERIPQEDGTTRIYMKDDGVPYKEKYKDVIRLEKLIHKKDTDVLTNLVKYRTFFWT